MYDHEIPTHLDVEDKMVLGLTGRQVGIALAGFSCAYGVWSVALFIPLVVRVVLGAAVLVAALALAVIRPGGEGLEERFFAWARYHAMPARATWRRSEQVSHRSAPTTPETGFIELDDDL
ncbi:MAG: PrgI family protein [Chloroflexia bacterium]